MSQESLKEEIQRATGKAYGTGDDASDIVAVLNEQMARWKTVAENEE